MIIKHYMEATCFTYLSFLQSVPHMLRLVSIFMRTRHWEYSAYDYVNDNFLFLGQPECKCSLSVTNRNKKWILMNEFHSMYVG